MTNGERRGLRKRVSCAFTGEPGPGMALCDPGKLPAKARRARGECDGIRPFNERRTSLKASGATSIMASWRAPHPRRGEPGSGPRRAGPWPPEPPPAPPAPRRRRIRGPAAGGHRAPRAPRRPGRWNGRRASARPGAAPSGVEVLVGAAPDGPRAPQRARTIRALDPESACQHGPRQPAGVEADGAVVEGLTIDGQAVAAGPGSRVEVAGIGALVFLESVSDGAGGLRANA